MKLISMWEPWATLMAIGAKRIETRSWATGYRGWLAIHASKGGLSKRMLTECMEEDAFRMALMGERLSPGCIVAVVRLVDCCPTDERQYLLGVFAEYPELDTEQERYFGNFDEGRWCWVTEDLFRLPEPIPFRAGQGLRAVPPEIETALREQWRSSGWTAIRGPMHTPASSLAAIEAASSYIEKQKKRGKT